MDNIFGKDEDSGNENDFVEVDPKEDEKQSSMEISMDKEIFDENSADKDIASKSKDSEVVKDT